MAVVRISFDVFGCVINFPSIVDGCVGELLNVLIFTDVVDRIIRMIPLDRSAGHIRDCTNAYERNFEHSVDFDGFRCVNVFTQTSVKVH